MYIKTFQNEYELCEFHHYVNVVEDEVVSVVELLVNSSIDKLTENEFTSIFIIEGEKQNSVFSGYSVDEFYEENEMTKIVLTK